MHDVFLSKFKMPGEEKEVENKASIDANVFAFALKHMPSIIIKGDIQVPESVEQPCSNVAELISMVVTKQLGTEAYVFRTDPKNTSVCEGCDVITLIIPHASRQQVQEF